MKRYILAKEFKISPQEWDTTDHRILEKLFEMYLLEKQVESEEYKKLKR